MKKMDFVPNLFGCVERDPTLARMLNRLRGESLGILGDCLFLAAAYEGDLRLGELFEELADRELEDFRFLARLIQALGGVDAPRLQLRLGGYGGRDGEKDALSGVPRELAERSRRLCVALERFSLRCNDPVVRAALSHLAEQRGERLDALERRLQ